MKKWYLTNPDITNPNIWYNQQMLILITMVESLTFLYLHAMTLTARPFGGFLPWPPAGLAPNATVSLFFFVKNISDFPVGKLLTPPSLPLNRDDDIVVFRCNNSLTSVSDPWRAFWSRRVILQGLSTLPCALPHQGHCRVCSSSTRGPRPSLKTKKVEIWKRTR